MVGLNDLRGLFQPKEFYSFIILSANECRSKLVTGSVFVKIIWLIGGNNAIHLIKFDTLRPLIK